MADEIQDIGQDVIDTVTDPQVIVTAAIIFVSQGYLGHTGAGFSASLGAKSAGVYLAVASASRALAPDLPSLSAFSADTLNSRGRQVQFRSPVSSRQIVYGTTRTSGPILFVGSKDNNQTLQLIIALSGEPINDVTKHYVNDEVVRTSHQDANGHSGNRLLNTINSSTYYTHLKAQLHFGGNASYPNQLQNTNFAQTAVVDGITHNLTYKNIAYAYIEHYFDATVYASGVPAHTFEIEGKQIFDPRNNTTAFSANPALVIRDFLTNGVYGLNCASSEIDDTSFISAANTCDETVGSEKRYEINGVIDTSRAPKAIIEDMLTACAGIIIFSGGKYKLLVGDYQAPTKTITKDMIVSPVTVSTKNPARSQVNSVKGTFRDKAQNYIATDFTPITDSVYFFEDDAEPNYIDLTLPFTTSKTMAERLALITLRQIRNEKTIQMSVDLHGFDIDVGDTVYFTDSRLGLNQATFQCVGWEIENNGKVPVINLTLRETSPNLFDTTAEVEPISRVADGSNAQDLSTVFGSFWTQDVIKEYLIPETVTISSERETSDNPSWSSSATPANYASGGAIFRRIRPAITIPANLKGKLIIRNRGTISGQGGLGGYYHTGSYFGNYSSIGERGGDCIHWKPTSNDNQPSDGGTVLLVNDGIIGAGGGGGRAFGKTISGTFTYCTGGTGKTGTNTGGSTSGQLLSDSFTDTTVNPNVIYIGGFGGDAGQDGQSYYTDDDGVAPWTSANQTQDNNGQVIRVDSDFHTDTSFNTSAYVQDSSGKSRFRINNRGTITGELHSAMSSLTDVFVS